MCGIAGKIDFRGAVDSDVINRMCAVMTHRGPDSRGVFVDGGVGLGMQRLAIIDVAGGDQPIFNEDRSLAVVMNGEIYNFIELRDSLAARGHVFSTNSDTEVLVHLYEDHGEHLVEELRGMFAFAIWDARRRRLVLGRDRVGKKPLFWAHHDGKVWFASEIRALLVDPELDRAVDYQALSEYLALQYVPHPRSIFRAIRKLPPATTVIVDSSGIREERYWELDYTRKLDGVSAPELEERLRALLWEATRIRLMSEVPLGAFLSGGIDSSAVVAAMADQMSEPVKTFSIGFPHEEYNELGYARMIAEQFSTDHHEFVVEPQALEIMPKLARHYGEPFADSSAIPSFYLSELTGRHVTVALNGDGGDETFAGYQRYITDDKVRYLDWLPTPLQRAASLGRFVREGPLDASVRTKINRMGRIFAMPPRERYSLRMSIFDGQRQRQLLTPEFAAMLESLHPSAFITDAWAESHAKNSIDVMLDTDVKTYLPGDLLVKMDIATMAYSVEARSPFLDHRLMEFGAALPADLKLAGLTGKRLLKSALRGILPDEILDRRKKGFSVPLAHWFRNDLRALPAEVLLDKRSVGRGYFQRPEVERLISEHQQGRADHSARLWVLLQLEYWHREVLEAPQPTLQSQAPNRSAT
jgi:asparagine synthase (glutamine-hydrolysing)